jgi:hypothetical protein
LVAPASGQLLPLPYNHAANKILAAEIVADELGEATALKPCPCAKRTDQQKTTALLATYSGSIRSASERQLRAA